MKVLLVTEANETVASGHLIECLEIGSYLLKRGYDVELLVNSDIQPELRDRINLCYNEYEVPIDKCVDFLIDVAVKQNANIVITNLRKISNCFIEEYNRKIGKVPDRFCKFGIDSYYNSIPLICIDEFGDRLLSCDAIVNPMIDSRYWNYPGKKCLEYCGQEYLVLSDSLVDYNNKKKVINDHIEVVTVSMGGVDARNHTMGLAQMLPDIFPDAEINIVCGGGYKHYDELCNLATDNKSIVVHRNIDYIYELFYKSDLTFCAGGNTLHELAAIGTPTIIIPSMPHEVNNGKCFVGMGFGVSIDNYRNYTIEDVRIAIELLRNRRRRVLMSSSGKRIVDGRGKERIVEIIETMI